MTAASPFPTVSGMPGQRPMGFQTECGETVPGWYVANQHQHPDEIIVKKDGVPLVPSFTVGQIAPSRRWAVGLDGELMNPVEFKNKLQELRYETYEILRRMGSPNAQYVGDIEAENVPTVEKFVSVAEDEHEPGRLRLIHYDRHKKPEADMNYFVDGKGEKVDGDKMEILCAAYHDPKLRGRLSEAERELVERSLGVGADAGPGEIATKLAQLNQLLADGDITTEVHSKRVAALTGVVAEAETEEPEEKPTRKSPPKKTMPCGAEIFAMHAPRHAKTCEEAACAAARKDTS